jgi:hypothetical protein
MVLSTLVEDKLEDTRKHVAYARDHVYKRYENIQGETLASNNE